MEIQGKMRVKESGKPIGIFIAGVLLFGLANGLVEKEYYRRVPDPALPIVQASSRKLVDECGVFMYADWHTPTDPTVDKAAPYVPMRVRIRQSHGRLQQ